MAGKRLTNHDFETVIGQLDDTRSTRNIALFILVIAIVPLTLLVWSVSQGYGPILATIFGGFGLLAIAWFGQEIHFLEAKMALSFQEALFERQERIRRVHELERQWKNTALPGDWDAALRTVQSHEEMIRLARIVRRQPEDLADTYPHLAAFLAPDGDIHVETQREQVRAAIQASYKSLEQA